MHANNDIVGTQHLRVSQYVAAHGPLHGKQAEAWLLEQAVGVVNLMKENLNEICVAGSLCMQMLACRRCKSLVTIAFNFALEYAVT